MVKGWLAIHICISRRFFPFRFLSIDLFFFPLLLACHLDIAIFICLLLYTLFGNPPIFLLSS